MKRNPIGRNGRFGTVIGSNQSRVTLGCSGLFWSEKYPTEHFVSPLLQDELKLQEPVLTCNRKHGETIKQTTIYVLK